MRNLGKTIGIAAIASFMAASSILLPFFQDTIDRFFLGQGVDFSSYSDENARPVCQAIEQESVVLLKNENNVLPLAGDKVTMFGVGSYHSRYAGAGSGGGDASDAVKLHEAMKERGIELCPEIEHYYDYYGSGDVDTGGFFVIGKEIGSTEIDMNGLTEEDLAAGKNFSKTAIYTYTRVGGEGSGLTDSLLGLSTYEEKTLRYVCENYDNVIVLLNSSNPTECGVFEGLGTSRTTSNPFAEFADKIDALVYIGLPGITGSRGVVDVLKGEDSSGNKVSPSGRLATTYAYDTNSSLSANAVGNAENIYIGYRWYETAAKEGILDYSSSTQTSLSWANKEAAPGVMYPFGYGLSYTTFSKEITTYPSSTTFDSSSKTDKIEFDVKVTNTGSASGKDVVQIYYTPNYIEGQIEKSYVNLLDFGKTKLLAAGESDTIHFSIPVSDLKSFDATDKNSNGFKGYEIDQGDCYLRVLDNAHDWVNVNESDSTKSIKLTISENIKYDKDPETNQDVNCLFTDYEGAREYVSRASHFANVAKNLEANIENKTYVLPDYSNETNNYTKGVDYEVENSKPIQFEEVVGLDYDDPKWDEYIKQFSKSELAELIAKGIFKTAAVERLGLPETHLFDGPAAVKDTYKSDKGCILYPSECTIGCSWDKTTLYNFGSSAADDAEQCGVTGWYAPGVNLFENALTSRGFEYFSEDPTLSGKYAVEESKGAYDNGFLVMVKHLLDGGTSTINEQTIREIYARPFELAIKYGESHGLMTSHNFLGTWVGDIPEICTDLIREEWGFVGCITSDAASSSMEVTAGIRAGNDIWLSTDSARYLTLVRSEKNIKAMQACVKNILYFISLSPNTLESTTTLTWSPSILAMVLVDVAGACGIGALAFLIVKDIKKKKEEKIVVEG